MSDVELGGVLPLTVTSLVANLQLETVQFLHHPGQFRSGPVKFILETSVGLFQVLTLLEPLGSAILSVASVFECSPLLLEPYDLLSGTTVQSFVQLAY